MIATVQRWSGRETRALREAMRLSVREFAEQLGVSHRNVSKWEAGGAEIFPRPSTQEVLDDALQNSPREVQIRFELNTQLARAESVEASATVAPSVGARPERAFLGTGRLTVSIASKREPSTKASVSEMISAECFTAFGLFAELARSVGLGITQEVVPAPGIVHLNRPNLIVLTNPRLLPFLSQVMEADPHIRYMAGDRDDWHLLDRTTGTEYHSPRNSGQPRDYGYVGRLPRPDGKGTFLYLAGTHAPGTLGAAAYLAGNLPMLSREVKTRRFSTIIECEFEPTNPLEIKSVERVAPLYHSNGA